jgi:hypothetical protein
MAARKRHWVWNLVIVITLGLCIAVFILHAKTWSGMEMDRMYLRSGFYYTAIPFADIEEVRMVPKIPSLERISGFSAWEVEKGIFKDTLTGKENIRVYVDDLSQEKIKVACKDSSLVFFNFPDSSETNAFFRELKMKLKN